MVCILSKDLNPGKQVFSNFFALIEKLTKEHSKINHAFIKRGLSVLLQGSKLCIERGLGYSRNGEKLILQDQYSIDVQNTDVEILFLEKVVIKAKKILIKDLNHKVIYEESKFELDSAVPRILRSKTIEQNPYSHEIFLNENILVLGFLKDRKFTPLNLPSQINNFPQGTILLYHGAEFRDFITLENFKKVDLLCKKYLKFGSEFRSVEEKEFYLFSDHLPLLNFAGKTSFNGVHTHGLLHEWGRNRRELGK